jgi:enediyne biosynthesis protein E4
MRARFGVQEHSDVESVLSSISDPSWRLVNTIGSVSNRDGIGAQLRLVSKSGAEQYAMVSSAGSYLSSSDKRVHFGLGGDASAKLLEITWPSGIVQRIENIAADRILTAREPSGQSRVRK